MDSQRRGKQNTRRAKMAYKYTKAIGPKKIDPIALGINKSGDKLALVNDGVWISKENYSGNGKTIFTWKYIIDNVDFKTAKEDFLKRVASPA